MGLIASCTFDVESITSDLGCGDMGVGIRDTLTGDTFLAGEGL